MKLQSVNIGWLWRIFAATVALILGSMSIANISNYYCFMFCDIIIYFNNLR